VCSALAGGAPKDFCITYDLRSLSPNYQYIMIPWRLYYGLVHVS